MGEPTSLNLAALQAVVTWIGTDGQRNHLYRQDNDHSLQVTLDTQYNKAQSHSGCTSLFKICVPVDLKALPHEKTALFLYIRPERVASLLCKQSDDSESPGVQAHNVDALIRAKLGPEVICLSFVLNEPADMVVPSGVPLVPAKQKPHGEQIDLLKHLAQSISFSIFLKVQDIGSPQLLRDFVDAITDPARTVRSDAESGGIASLYLGQGGRILNSAELSASGPRVLPPLPPSYDDVEAPPPMAPLEKEQAAGPSTSCKSRKRRRDSGMDEARSGPGVEAASQITVESMHRQLCQEIHILRQSQIEDRAFMKEFIRTEIQTVKADIMAEIQNKKTEMIQYIDRRTDELDGRLYDVEKGIEDTNDRVDVQVDDAILNYKIEADDEKEDFKSEMREYVTEQLDGIQERAVEEVEENVMDRINGARVSVEQARIRLE